jgi:hypothetical protein
MDYMKDDKREESTGRLALYICSYSEPHSQKSLPVGANFLLMWLLRHIKLLFCTNASIHRKQFCMALNSYKI